MMPSQVSDDLKTNGKATAISAAAMPLISPTALLQAHLQQSPPTRPSSRSPNQTQPIDLNTGSLTHTNGSAVVKIGSTTVVCGVRAEILPTSEIPSYDPKTSTADNTNVEVSTWPEQQTPISLYNLLVPNLELSTGCSPLHPANAAPSIQAQSLSQRLYTLLLTSHTIQSSDLAITYTPPVEADAELDPDDPAYIVRETETKAFWVLYIDMVCISYGGQAGVFDAAWLSLYAALRDTVLPRAWWDADEKVVMCDSQVSKGRSLRLMGVPVPIGFAAFKAADSTWVLADPDAFEEQCCDEVGCLTVDISSERKGGPIVRIEKIGGGIVGTGEIKQILGHAEKRWKEWTAILQRTAVRGTKAG